MKSILLAATIAAIPAIVQAQVMTPAEYIATAGGSDLYEITSSRSVLKTTQDPKIRGFAQEMIADHTKSTAKVKAAAARSGVRPSPAALNPLQTELIAELEVEQGPARDATYLAQQRASHGQALDVQRAYAEGGKTPSLKASAAAIVPVVKHHIEMLKAM